MFNQIESWWFTDTKTVNSIPGLRCEHPLRKTLAEHGHPFSDVPDRKHVVTGHFCVHDSGAVKNSSTSRKAKTGGFKAPGCNVAIILWATVWR